MAIFYYEDEAGERIHFGTDDDKDEREFTLFRTGAAEKELGQLYCFWEAAPLDNFFREILSRLISEVHASLEELGPVEPIDEDELQIELDRMIGRISELFGKRALDVFAEAQWRLIIEILDQVFREEKFTISDGSENVSVPWGTSDVIKEFRESMFKELQTLQNRRMGIRSGRPSEPLPDECLTYCNQIKVLIGRARNLLRQGQSIEEIQINEQFELLGAYSDLMSRIAHQGRDGEPGRLAREYTIRKFKLNVTENALEVRMRDLKKRGNR